MQRATRPTDWTQLGIGACVLVLPPLALGAALYSMLDPADGDKARSGGADAVLPDDRQPAAPAGLAATAASGPIAGGQQPADLPAAAEGRAPPVQVVTPGFQAPAAPAAANPPADGTIESAAAPVSAQSPPAAAAAPKRSIRRNAQRQPQPPPQQDKIKTWLQQIGLLPPYR